MFKKVKIESKSSIGTGDVYDIEVENAHHYILEDGTVSHNSGFIYASSIVVAMKKMKLKEDAEGNKIAAVKGIRAGCKIMKTRYAKPFESVQVKIPYDTGMSPYSGMFDLIEKRELLKRTGNSYIYVLRDGTELKAFRKKWEHNEDGLLDKVMDDMMFLDLAVDPIMEEVDDPTDGEVLDDINTSVDVDQVDDANITSSDANNTE
jgi:hypothetical protein